MAAAAIDRVRAPSVPAPTEPTRRSLRVVVAAAHEGLRTALRRRLEMEDDFELAEDCPALDLIGDALRRCPAVLVLDLAMARGAVVAVLGRFRADVPGTAVVALSFEDTPAFARHVLAAGASGFVLMQRADADLADAVRCVADGVRYTSPPLATKLAARGGRFAVAPEPRGPRHGASLRGGC